MQAILKFIYHSSCEVGVEDLKGFLEAEREQKIYGLQDNLEQKNINESSWPLADTQYEDSIHSELFSTEKLEMKENRLNQLKPSHEIKGQAINTTFMLMFLI